MQHSRKAGIWPRAPVTVNSADCRALQFIYTPQCWMMRQDVMVSLYVSTFSSLRKIHFYSSNSMLKVPDLNIQYVVSRLQTKSKVLWELLFWNFTRWKFCTVRVNRAIWFLLVLTGWDDSCPQQDEPVSSPIGAAAMGKEAEDKINTGDVHAGEEKITPVSWLDF